MKRDNTILTAAVTLLILLGGIVAPEAHAQIRLRYACSDQVQESLGDGWIQAFSQASGVEVEKFVTNSFACINRLMNDLADIAITTRGLPRRRSGYVETPFCRDPFAVIVNARNPIGGLSETELRDIFSGKITNWKEVGGTDEKIIVVAPGTETATYRNFEREFMKRDEIVYDVMTRKSTMIIEVAKRFSSSISFIAHAAVFGAEGVKALAIDGALAHDPKYPYQQTFYLVVGEQPSGTAKAFISFIFSDKGREIMKKKGMVPLPE